MQTKEDGGEARTHGGEARMERRDSFEKYIGHQIRFLLFIDF